MSFKLATWFFGVFRQNLLSLYLIILRKVDIILLRVKQFTSNLFLFDP